LLGRKIREKVVAEVKQASIFSVLAGETKVVGSIEQFSILVRYVQVQLGGSPLVREEFLGFTEAVDMSGEALNKEILNNLMQWGLVLMKIHGQGYDGASLMAGKFKGVQAQMPITLSH